ncbi:hypothetical protein Hanom_Chr16g01455691 [Helianthus anomalus]
MDFENFYWGYNLSKINWCAYVIQQIKSCKVGWKMCDHDSPFFGPLTFLALLYVDRVKCTRFEVDRSINPIISEIKTN